MIAGFGMALLFYLFGNEQAMGLVYIWLLIAAGSALLGIVGLIEKWWKS